MKSTSATILGGGLCGSLLAVVLARRQFKVSLLERQPDPRNVAATAGRSINLAMSARGIRALKHAGVFAQVEPLMMSMQGRMIHEMDGSTELHRYGQKDTEVIFSVSRVALNRILLDCAQQHENVSIRYEHEGISYDPEDSILRVRDHASGNDLNISAKPLIAADGAGSIVRRAFGHNEPIGATEELLPHSYKELTIPAGNDGRYQLYPNALHVWPRGDFMLIALPNPGGDFTLTLFMPSAGDTSFSSLDSLSSVDNRQAVLDFFNTHFADVTPIIDDLVGSWNRNPVGILGTVRCKHWHDSGNAMLIGDAAHAVVPFHAQGMNLAFDDCVILDGVLDRTELGWPNVFNAFEEEQLANANAIADMALENYVEMRDTVRDPKYVLRKELSFALERALPTHLIPRYSMVMFHDEIPYAIAQQRGRAQEALLSELTIGIDSIDEIDFDAAIEIVRNRLTPL